MTRCLVLGFAAACTLLAQQPERQELLDALARTAAIFSRTAPSLTAREVLDQRGRRGNMQVRRRGRNNEPKDVTFFLPEAFEMHHVVSDYSLGSPGPGGGFHEIRKTVTFDGVPPSAVPPARHALTLGSKSGDDENKKKILESLAIERLQGAATDFGPLMLLFTSARQRTAEFSGLAKTFAERAARDVNGPGAGWTLHFRQTEGGGSLTEFRDSRETRHLPEGDIWFRENDLMPLRITLNTEEAITPKYLLRNEARIDYQATKFGLAPHTVVHRQYLNRELLVENTFSYSNYGGLEMAP